MPVPRVEHEAWETALESAANVLSSAWNCPARAVTKALAARNACPTGRSRYRGCLRGPPLPLHGWEYLPDLLYHRLH